MKIKRLLWLQRHYYKDGVTLSAQAVFHQLCKVFHLRKKPNGKTWHRVMKYADGKYRFWTVEVIGVRSHWPRRTRHICGKVTFIGKLDANALSVESRCLPLGKADLKLFIEWEQAHHIVEIQKKLLKLKGWFIRHRSKNVRIVA
jgi:hypothetical protein